MIHNIILIIANYYNKQYSSIWTIMIPFSFLIGYVLKNLDVWAFKNEKNEESKSNTE
jgi:general stress protein CsbA